MDTGCCAKKTKNLITIVDDSVMNRILLSEILNSNGYTVSQAENGQSALDQINIKKPSLILLDIMMPKIDGFEVCRRLKANPCTSDIPVIFISALDDLDSRINGFQVGGVDYITKPFQKNEVLARVATHIQLYQLQQELKIKNQNLEEEISFRKKTEEALRQSEEQFRSIVDSSPISMYFYQLQNNQLIFKGANPSADRMIGIDHQLLIGKTITEAFPELAKTEIPEMYARIAKGTLGIQQFETEYHDLKINGSYKVTVFQTDTNTICVNFVEVSDRKRAEIALKASEEKFRSLFEHSPNGKSMTTIDGTILVNRAFCQMVGYTPDELNAEKWTGISHPDDIENTQAILDSLKRGEISEAHFEKRYIHKNGTIIWASISTFLQRDKEGNPLYYITSTNNITEKKLAEELLNESEKRLHLSLKVNNATVFENNFKTGNIISTPELYEFLGYQPDEIPITIEASKEFIHPDDILHVLNAQNDHFTGKAPEYYAEFRMRTKIGDWRWVDGRGKVIQWDENGEPVVLLGISRDIHEYKLAAESFRESEDRYNAFINASIDLFFVKDDQFRYLMANNSMAQFFGKKKEELLNKTDQQLTTENLYLPCNSSDKKALKSTAPFTIEEQLGDHIYETTKFPISLKNNKRGIGGIMHDITYRKKDEEKITYQNNRLNAIIEAIPDLIFISDREGNYIEFLNPTEKELLFPTEELIGANVKDIFDRATAELHIQKINECLNQKRLITYEYTGTKEGVSSFFEARIVYLDNNFALRFVRDITLRKITQIEIQEEKQLLRTLIDNLPVSIYVKDKEGRKVISNQTDVANIGYNIEAEVWGKTDKELFAGEIGIRGYNDDMQIIHSGEAIINQEEVFPNEDGSSRWTITSKLPLYDQNRNITGIVGIGRDITEQKKANATIHKLSLSIEQNPSSIVITDVYGTIEYVNPRFTEVTGYTSDEVIGRNPRILKSDETSSQTYQEMWKALTSGQIWKGEFHNRRKNGELYWEWAILTSIKNEKGIITNYVAIKEDITIRKQMEVDLVLAKEKAEENDRLKSSFLANMSHEIRTPLNSILGFADLLSNREIEEDSTQRIMFANLIISSGNNLLNIINDILDLSKIESGQIQVSFNKFPIQKMLQNIWNEYNMKASEKGIKLTLNIDPSHINTYINSDESKLKQVLINFIGNAIKFTEKGVIEMRVESQENNQLKFLVKDTGIGIPQEYIQHIFERFRQIEGAATRKYGGNGLGLAISKSLIEILGGTIGVESTEGKGSTFYFTIPKNRKPESNKNEMN